jgi:hypothetical protein
MVWALESGHQISSAAAAAVAVAAAAAVVVIAVVVVVYTTFSHLPPVHILSQGVISAKRVFLCFVS